MYIIYIYVYMIWYNSYIVISIGTGPHGSSSPWSSEALTRRLCRKPRAAKLKLGQRYKILDYYMAKYMDLIWIYHTDDHHMDLYIYIYLKNICLRIWVYSMIITIWYTSTLHRNIDEVEIDTSLRCFTWTGDWVREILETIRIMVEATTCSLNFG